jgi:hypothetical protein
MFSALLGSDWATRYCPTFRSVFSELRSNYMIFTSFYIDLLKGTHAQDFHSLFLNFFLHLSLTNRYKRQYGQHFRKKFLKFAQIFKGSDNSPFSPKARSMAERCCRKLNVKLSAVFVTVRGFRIVLSVVGVKAESNFTFSAKARS